MIEQPIGEGFKEPLNETSKQNEVNERDCSEAERPVSTGVTEAAKGRGGSSNTPHTKPKINTCIDYLKIRFNVGYEKNPSFFEKLFKELGFNPDEFGREGVYNNYLHHLQMGVGATLAFGGTMTLTAKGEETTLLELKGQACRRFEERRWLLDENNYEKKWEDAITEYWCSLLELVKFEMEGICTRVDLPTDCLDGFIKTDDIRQKIKNREYTTTMRSLQLTDEGDAPELTLKNGQSKSLMGVATIKDSALAGYTATFGTRKSVQLCIYDKAAEQWNQSGKPEHESWIRFEVRYYHSAADQEMIPLIQALQSGKIEKHILGCLATAIDFKEPNNKDESHRSEAKRWDKWDALLCGTPKGKAFAEIRGAYAIDKMMMMWLVREVSKPLAKCSLAFELDPAVIA